MRQLAYFGVLVIVGLLSTPATLAQDDSPTNEEAQASLFDSVVKQLETRYVDKTFRAEKLPAIVERYRDPAERAKTLNDQRQVVHELLSNIPATHMGLLSETTFDTLLGELAGRTEPTFGFELVNYDGKYFAHNVLEGGPAAKAGLLRGDRILLIDDQFVDGHPRLDWRSDDSFLEDPAVHYLLCKEGDSIRLQIGRSWNDEQELMVNAEPYSAFEAARASAMVITDGDYRFGHIHFWMIHMSGVSELLKEKLQGDFADCDALLLDLRGRGGNGMALPGIYDVLSGKKSTWNKPVIALINRHSRSAKEVIAYELKKRKLATVVGERTAGAVIPATFARVGHESVLMFPTFRFGQYTDLIEGVGVAPNILVRDAGPYSAGADPLLGAGLRVAKRLVDNHVASVGESSAAENHTEGDQTKGNTDK